jgi:hypothetical protein
VRRKDRRMNKTFYCSTIIDYDEYIGLRKKGKDIFLKITIPAIFLLIVMAFMPLNLIFNLLRLVVLLTVVFSILSTILSLLTSPKNPLSRELYRTYVENYFVHFSPTEMIISRSDCLPYRYRKKYGGFRDIYMKVQGVGVHTTSVQYSNIKSIKLIKIYLERHSSYFIELETYDGKGEFILTCHFDLDLTRYIFENFRDKISVDDRNSISLSTFEENYRPEMLYLTITP